MSSSLPLNFSLREQIVERLRMDVLCGRFADGEHLSEVKLAEKFGVSRTPVREALQQLTHEGLLEGRPNVGLRVAVRPPNWVQEFVVPIRRTVEILALRSIYDQLDESDFGRLNEILQLMRKACVARDYAAMCEQDIAFHRYIVTRARQRDIEMIWSMLLGRMRTHFRESYQRDYSDPLQIWDEHLSILDVFRTGDLDASVAVLEKNIE